MLHSTLLIKITRNVVIEQLTIGIVDKSAVVDHTFKSIDKKIKMSTNVVIEQLYSTVLSKMSLKPSYDTRFQRAFTACVGVF